MKKCPKCGTVQSDDRSMCVDCDAHLGAKMSETDEAELNEEMKEKISSLTERADDFHVSLFDKILLVLNILMVIAQIVLIFIFKDYGQKIYVLLYAVLLIFPSVYLVKPHWIWELNLLRANSRYGNADQLIPGALWVFERKVVSIIFLLMGVLLIVDICTYNTQIYSDLYPAYSEYFQPEISASYSKYGY